MKAPRGFLLFSFVLILLGVFPAAGSAATSVGLHVDSSGRATVDLGFFYDDLAPYGSWVERPSYGWVFRPHAVASSWRPYQRGHWVQTEDGWTWISSEPYGWATYHYGRWYRDPIYGWEWVPGEEWAPAWVSWQEGGDYVGWAPLPPSVEFNGGFGGVDFSAAIAPENYLFVPERQFLAPRLDTYYVAPSRQVDIYRQTRNITSYNVVNNRIINQGLPVDRIQRVIGRPVPRYQIADQGANQRHQGGQVQANRVAFFRPQIQKANVAPPPERPAARRAVVSPSAAPTATAPAAPAGREARPSRQGRPQGQAVGQDNRPSHRQEVQTAPRPETAAPQTRRQRPPQPPSPSRPAEASQPDRPQKPRPQQQQRPPQAADRPHGQGQSQGQGQGQGHPQGQGKPQGKPPGKPQERPHGNPKDKPPSDGGPGR